MVSLLAESWTWFSVATLVLLTRCVARLHHVGSWKKLQVDDWLMVLALCFYTVEIVAMNNAASPATNLLPPGYLDTHDIDNIHERINTAKWVIVVELCQCVTIWLLKACLLIMYARFTAATYPRTNLLVRILLGYVILSFVVMELLYFTCWCRPFSNYWAVPSPNPQCSAATNHLITNAVFNLTSDVLTLCITLPLFARTSLPFERKASLCVVFGLGIFTIICAVLNKYYSFTNPYGLEWTNWYLREVSTAILVANLPFMWGIVRRICHFDSSGSLSHSSGNPLEQMPSHDSRRRWLNPLLRRGRSDTGPDRPMDSLPSDAGAFVKHKTFSSASSMGMGSLSMADVEAGSGDFRRTDMASITGLPKRPSLPTENRDSTFGPEDQKYLGRAFQDPDSPPSGSHRTGYE